LAGEMTRLENKMGYKDSNVNNKNLLSRFLRHSQQRSEVNTIVKSKYRREFSELKENIFTIARSITAEAV